MGDLAIPNLLGGPGGRFSVAKASSWAPLSENYRTTSLTDGELDPSDYRRQRDRLRERMAVVEANREETDHEHLDINAVLAFAELALTDAAGLWKRSSPEHRRRLQTVYFPEGIAWDVAGTAATASAFTELRALAGPRGRLASPTGFELAEGAARLLDGHETMPR